MTREEAIDVLKHNYPSTCFTDLCEAVDIAIRALSIHPECKKGKWIWWYEEAFTEHATEYTPHCKCSECGRECAPSVATSSNFCRNCGADMRGKSE